MHFLAISLYYSESGGRCQQKNAKIFCLSRPRGGAKGRLSIPFSVAIRTPLCYTFRMQCFLCPVKCGADRDNGTGACGAKGISVAKACIHRFEEPFLSPLGKSGAIFFSGCSLRCVFCQNFEVSRARKGREIRAETLASLFRSLEERGAENIDLVTADHLIPYLSEAFSYYRPRVPVIFNSGGYVTAEALGRIDPYIDVYLPDFKFYEPLLAEKFTGRRDYPAVAAEAVRYMAKKPPVYENGQLKAGLAVRHLVLPSHTEDSKRVLDTLIGLIPPGTPLSIMRQYTPMGDIAGFPELNRRVTDREYERVVNYAVSLGFSDIYTQEKSSADKKFIPDWDGETEEF